MEYVKTLCFNIIIQNIFVHLIVLCVFKDRGFSYIVASKVSMSEISPSNGIPFLS